MATLATFIQSERNKRSLSQEEVAMHLGITRPTFAQVERGERELKVSEAVELASLFDMTLEQLLEAKAPKRDVHIAKQTKRKKQDLQVRVTEKNLEKFKQVLLYVLGKVGGKPNVGETVLHKLLYFIDFDYYEKFEKTLMGAKYIKNHHGPTSVELKVVLDAMQVSGQIEAVKSKYFTYEQKKYLPLKRPDLSAFSAQEIEHIDEVLARLADKNAKEIENYSHEDIPWKSAKNGEELSYESVFYRDERYSVRNYDDDL
jgi:transcriptional regulator with XRE-family HTH domain